MHIFVLEIPTVTPVEADSSSQVGHQVGLPMAFFGHLQCAWCIQVEGKKRVKEAYLGTCCHRITTNNQKT